MTQMDPSMKPEEPEQSVKQAARNHRNSDDLIALGPDHLCSLQFV